jgi:hypothetical protein
MAASARRVSGWQATGGERNRRADMGGRTEVLSPLRPFFFTSLVGHRRRPHSPHPSTLTWASRWDSIIFDCFFHFIFYYYIFIWMLLFCSLFFEKIHFLPGKIQEYIHIQKLSIS